MESKQSASLCPRRLLAPSDLGSLAHMPARTSTGMLVSVGWTIAPRWPIVFGISSSRFFVLWDQQGNRPPSPCGIAPPMHFLTAQCSANFDKLAQPNITTVDQAESLPANRAMQSIISVNLDDSLALQVGLTLAGAVLRFAFLLFWIASFLPASLSNHKLTCQNTHPLNSKNFQSCF